MRDSLTYQAVLREGRLEGRLEEARALLFRHGRRRFGPPNPRIVTIVEAISDLEHVEQLTDRLLDVATWDELLTGPSNRSPAG